MVAYRSAGLEGGHTIVTSELAALSAFDFVELLHSTLDMRFMLMGPDNAFGRGREGTPSGNTRPM